MMTNAGGEETDSTSEEEDEEAVLRLREAVDNNFHRSAMVDRTGPLTEKPVASTHSAETSRENDINNVNESKSLSDKIKSLVGNFEKRNKKKSTNVENSKSLRRDKQENVDMKVMSELNVTPQFQKFVGTKLDQLMSEQIEDIFQYNDLNTETESRPTVKLLSRSRTNVEDVDCDTPAKRLRPDLLSHRQSRPSEVELADIAVSGEFVLSRTDTEAWVNRYPHRTVPGVQRIKKKKKKVKKKKTAEAVPDPGPT